MAQDPAIVVFEYSEDRTIFIGTTVRGRSSILLMAKGDFGGGDLKPGYLDLGGQFRAMSNAIELDADGQLEVPTGTGMQFAVVLIGSTNPDLKIFVLADSFQLSGET